MHQAPLELIAARNCIDNLGDYFSLFVFKLCCLYNKNRNLEFQDQTACWVGLIL